MTTPATDPGLRVPEPLEDVSGLVGNTPLVRLGSVLEGPVPEGSAPEGSGASFWAKLEGQNPGGLKSRAALSMVRAAECRGALAPGGVIIESTSGTLGLALAFVGVLSGYRVLLVGDPGLEPMVRAMLHAHGVELDIVGEPHPLGGWQEARRRRVEQMRAAHPGAFTPDQYNNPDNPAGYADLAAELAGQLDRIDVLVCSVGTGGHSRGIARVLRRRWPGMRLVGVDSVQSTLFGQPAGPRLMRGLGSSIHPRNVDHAAFDEVHWVAPAESVWACRALARRRWVTGGWSTGAVALVSSWVAQDTDDVVAAVFPDGPERYWDTVFSEDFCARHGLRDVPAPQAPHRVVDPDAHTADRWSCTTEVIGR